MITLRHVGHGRDGDGGVHPIVPSGSAGRSRRAAGPAAVDTSVQNASAWQRRSRPIRRRRRESTTPAAPRRRSRRGPAMSPKRTDDVWVTVPPRATCAAPFCSSASVSHDQPTVGSISSPTCSGSSRAWTKQTSRNRPSQASCPAGSCRRIRRPDVSGSSRSSPGRAVGVGLDADGPGVGREPGWRVERGQRPAPGAAAPPTARRPRAGTPPEGRSGRTRAGTLDRSAGSPAQARR